jgi:pimeloyl-ACP methyl ester carboxylesterase
LFEKVAEIAANGRLVQAAEYFIEHSHIIYSLEELATGVPKAFWQVAAKNIPVFLAEQAAIYESSMPNPMDPAILSNIQAPVLLMLGTKTTPYFTDSLKYVANHIQNVLIQKIDQAAHFGICTHPEAVAEAIHTFISTV